MLSELEQTYLVYWLFAIAAFEVPNVYNYLIADAPLNGFFSTLTNASPERRLWCL